MILPLLSHEFIATSLIALPSLLALMSAVSYNKAVRYFVVYVTFVLLTLISIVTFQSVLSSESHLVTWSYQPQADLIIMLMDFGLLIFFLYVGIVRKHPIVVLLTILQLVPLIYLETSMHGIKTSPTILIDPLSAIMCLIICIVGSLIVVYSLNYMEEHEEHLHLERTRQPRFLFFMILLLAAMNGVVISNNLYWLYFFWEVTTLCCYQLIRHDLTEQAERNALLALWMGLVGGVAFVGSMLIGVIQLHSLTLSEIINAKAPIYIPLLLAFLSLAAFTKSAQVPFHSWLLGAMIAPTPVSALLHSSTMVKAGIYLILRISPGLINFPALSYSVAAVGGLSFLATSILAISQRESKRILAYSTIGNLGLIILCAGLNTPLTLLAAMLLAIFHAMSKGLLFLGAGVIENRIQTRNIEDWEGLIGKYPFSTIVMLVGMLMMYLPPFGMLIGKWLTIEAVSSTPIPSIAIPFVLILAIGSAATAFFWSKWMGHMLTYPPALINLRLERIPFSYKLSMLTIAGSAVVLSALAGLVISLGDMALKVLRRESPTFYSIWEFFTGIGSFPVVYLFLMFILVVTVAWLLGRVKKGYVAPPYLCGENVREDPYSLISTADKPIKFDVSNVFFDKRLGSPSVNKIISLIGVMLLILVFLVVI